MTQPQRFAFGLDLGQVSDYSALAGIRERMQTQDERADQLADHAAAQRGKAAPVPAPESHQDMPLLYRWPLKTAYPKIVGDVVTFTRQLRQRLPGARIYLIIDGTGVGRAVVDMFAARRGELPRDMVALTITGGTAQRFEMRPDGVHDWHIPKRDLVGAAQFILQTKRLHIDRALPEAATLRKELETFKLKFTQSANMQYEAWRDGDHDDLVLAAALASWALQRGPLGQPLQAAAGGKRAETALRAGGSGDLPPLR